jgi:hypothetical protein
MQEECAKLRRPFLTSMVDSCGRELPEGTTMDDQIVWRISSYSSNGTCVEIGFADSHVLVRDSKDRQGAVLRFTAAEWETFLNSVRAGDLSPATIQGASRRLP